MSAADYLQRYKYRIFFCKYNHVLETFLRMDVILLSNQTLIEIMFIMNL